MYSYAHTHTHSHSHSHTHVHIQTFINMIIQLAMSPVSIQTCWQLLDNPNCTVLAILIATCAFINIILLWGSHLGFWSTLANIATNKWAANQPLHLRLYNNFIDICMYLHCAPLLIGWSQNLIKCNIILIYYNNYNVVAGVFFGTIKKRDT